jgi:hypothetical protein
VRRIIAAPVNGQKASTFSIFDSASIERNAMDARLFAFVFFVLASLRFSQNQENDSAHIRLVCSALFVEVFTLFCRLHLAPAMSFGYFCLPSRVQS